MWQKGLTFLLLTITIPSVCTRQTPRTSILGQLQAIFENIRENENLGINDVTQALEGLDEYSQDDLQKLLEKYGAKSLLERSRVRVVNSRIRRSPTGIATGADISLDVNGMFVGVSAFWDLSSPMKGGNVKLAASIRHKGREVPLLKTEVTWDIPTRLKIANEINEDFIYAYVSGHHYVEFLDGIDFTKPLVKASSFEVILTDPEVKLKVEATRLGNGAYGFSYNRKTHALKIITPQGEGAGNLEDFDFKTNDYSTQVWFKTAPKTTVDGMTGKGKSMGFAFKNLGHVGDISVNMTVNEDSSADNMNKIWSFSKHLELNGKWFKVKGQYKRIDGARDCWLSIKTNCDKVDFNKVKAIGSLKAGTAKAEVIKDGKVISRVEIQGDDNGPTLKFKAQGPLLDIKGKGILPKVSYPPTFPIIMRLTAEGYNKVRNRKVNFSFDANISKEAVKVKYVNKGNQQTTVINFVKDTTVAEPGKAFNLTIESPLIYEWLNAPYKSIVGTGNISLTIACVYSLATDKGSLSLTYLFEGKTDWATLGKFDYETTTKPNPRLKVNLNCDYCHGFIDIDLKQNAKIDIFVDSLIMVNLQVRDGRLQSNRNLLAVYALDREEVLKVSIDRIINHWHVESLVINVAVNGEDVTKIETSINQRPRPDGYTGPMYIRWDDPRSNKFVFAQKDGKMVSVETRANKYSFKLQPSGEEQTVVLKNEGKFGNDFSKKLRVKYKSEGGKGYARVILLDE